jgi:hypothetical protein
MTTGGSGERTLGLDVPRFLAMLSAGAGVVHLAQAGEHFDVSVLHGTFFAVVGWLQLAWAMALVLRPERRVIVAGVALSLGVVAVWAVSRLWGVPGGSGSGEPEAIGLADGLATGFEATIVLVGAALLRRPALLQRTVRPALARPGLALGAVAVTVASTLALTPAFATDRHHGDAATDGHASGDHAMAGHDGGEAHGEATVIRADGTSACEQAGVANEGNSGHGHRGPVPIEPIDAATRHELAGQIAQANSVIARLPTVADAEAAGYRRVSPYVPCIAAHYVKTGALMGNGFDPGEPEVVLYAGTDPDSQVVGLSYLVFGGDEPEGFAGPNDPWHNHERLCLADGGVIGIETATPEGCAARGGRMRNVGNIWMTHMWNVPAWESSWGMFSSEHPDLGGRMGDIDASPDPEADDTWFEERPAA